MISNNIILLLQLELELGKGEIQLIGHHGNAVVVFAMKCRWTHSCIGILPTQKANLHLPS